MDCMQIPKISYGEFSHFIHKDASKKRIPIGGGFEPTFRCNLKCVHCYATKGLKSTRQELSLQEICKVFDEISNEGCLWLLITGGEPLIRNDFLDIYTNAKKRGFIVSLFTNGTLVNTDIVDCLRKWRPFNIEITLYGATKKTYESITRIPGSFEKCIQGIDLLLKENLPLRLKSIIMTLNRHEIDELRYFSKSHGMPFLFDPILSRALNGSKSPCKYRLTPKQIVELDVADPERFKSWKEYLADFRGKPSSDKLYICGAGETSFFINPYGELQLCVLSRSPSYDLRQGAFPDGWYSFFGEIRNKSKVRRNFRCRNCELISLCGQCPGWSYLEYGNWDTPVEYLCQVAHLRAEAIMGNRTKKKGG